mgnify:CR=1 FL=1
MDQLDNEYRAIIDSLYSATLSDELVWSRKNITSELLTLNTKGGDSSEFEMVFYWSFNGTIWRLAEPYIKVKNSKIEFSINQNISNKIINLKSEFRDSKLTKILKND